MLDWVTVARFEQAVRLYSKWGKSAKMLSEVL